VDAPPGAQLGRGEAGRPAHDDPGRPPAVGCSRNATTLRVAWALLVRPACARVLVSRRSCPRRSP